MKKSSPYAPAWLLKSGAEWCRPETRPGHGIVVIAQVQKGLDGVAEIEVFHNGFDWCEAETNRRLPDACAVLRWRFKKIRADLQRA